MEWEAQPLNVLSGKGCPKCKGEKIRKNRTRSHEDYVNELSIKAPKIITIDTYINARTPILHKCLNEGCGCEWMVQPDSILTSGTGCPKCAQVIRNEKRRRTNEQYIKELKGINPNVIALEPYDGATTQILHKCLVCNWEWSVIPETLLRGGGCPKCANKKRGKRKWTLERYENELAIVNPNIKVIGEYNGCAIPVLHECLIDGYQWFATSDYILGGHGCPKCAGNAKRTNEEYIAEVAKINPNIVVLEKYINAKTPILHQCKIDGNIWSASPGNILSGHGCPECRNRSLSEKRRKPHEEYVQEVKEINPNIKVLGEYTAAKVPILHKCLVADCGYEWLASPGSILSGTGCPICAKKKIGDKNRKTNEQYLQEVKNRCPGIEVVATYEGIKTPIKHRCSFCGREWLARPETILAGRGCPVCNKSKGEKAIYNWLIEHKIFVEPQKRFDDCKDIKPLPFDFYLPELNIAIEYDGKQHFTPNDYFGGEEALRYLQKHDKIKNEYCEENGIRLLRIPYNKDIETELNNFIYSA